MKRPRQFAAGTKVPVGKSRVEIESLVRKLGAKSFGSITHEHGATIIFEVRGRRIRFELPLPRPLGEQEERRRWRCLLLSIKSKFETVASGIVSFDEEFLAHIVVPGRNETIGTWAAPQIVAAYERGVHMPPLLEAKGAQ